MLRDKCRRRYGGDNVPVPVPATTRAVAWIAFRALRVMTGAVAVEDAMFR